MAVLTDQSLSLSLSLSLSVSLSVTLWQEALQSKVKRREYMRGRRQQERDEISCLETKVGLCERVAAVFISPL
jgi:hypothetical protein